MTQLFWHSAETPKTTLICSLAGLLLALVSIPATTSAQNASDGAMQQHLNQLRKKLPGDGFHIRIEQPFVVVGDESPEMLKRRCRSIRWAVDRLKNQYFKHDPDQIIDIWLFRNKQSYETNVKKLFGEKPGTPFGYYSSRHRALVMNISTGGGTLVHEIVHPFIERNFADCPSWFNEGLASLYEQSGDDKGQIVGFTNWRLAGLQRAIAGDDVPSFKALCETTTNEFYREDPGTNYSQARYLCYYLQQQGKLRSFYDRFRRNVKDDPTGYKTLMKTLGEDDMDAFKSKWEKYVLGLRFP